jgi:hypothetical protein
LIFYFIYMIWKPWFERCYNLGQCTLNLGYFFHRRGRVHTNYIWQKVGWATFWAISRGDWAIGRFCYKNIWPPCAGVSGKWQFLSRLIYIEKAHVFVCT